MKPSFLPRLVNEAFSDPVLFVDFRFRRRALLLDLGDIDALANRALLRVSQVFVSHAHMDHFYGFDRLLRVTLARRERLDLYGPPGFTDHLAHRLQGYTWNLVGNYAEDMAIHAWEWDGARLQQTVFSMKARFRVVEHHERPCRDGILLTEPGLTVRAALLDHGIPVLAFALEEGRHVNVWKNRLDALGLPTGPWLRTLKAAVLADRPDDTPIDVPSGSGMRRLPLGNLRREVLRVVPGMRLAYVVDCRYHDDNARRIVELARGADYLFIEAPFSADEAPLAAAKAHLTTAQAGSLAREAGVKRVIPIHFSRRHEHEAARLYEEVAAAAGPSVACLSGPSLPQAPAS